MSSAESTTFWLNIAILAGFVKIVYSFYRQDKDYIDLLMLVTLMVVIVSCICTYVTMYM